MSGKYDLLVLTVSPAGVFEAVRHAANGSSVLCIMIEDCCVFPRLLHNDYHQLIKEQVKTPEALLNFSPQMGENIEVVFNGIRMPVEPVNNFIRAWLTDTRYKEKERINTLTELSSALDSSPFLSGTDQYNSEGEIIERISLRVNRNDNRETEQWMKEIMNFHGVAVLSARVEELNVNKKGITISGESIGAEQIYSDLYPSMLPLLVGKMPESGTKRLRIINVEKVNSFPSTIQRDILVLREGKIESAFLTFSEFRKSISGWVVSSSLVTDQMLVEEIGRMFSDFNFQNVNVLYSLYIPEWGQYRKIQKNIPFKRFHDIFPLKLRDYITGISSIKKKGIKSWF